MAITNASRLADFGSGIGTQGSVIQVDNTNKRVGLGTTNPQSTLQVGIAITMDGTAGVITAVSYHGDGSALTGMASTDNIITGVAVTVGGILRVTDTTQSTSTTTGSVIVSGGVGIAKSLNVGGNISVGGTLTYEDVTNVDSIGIITARSGIKFGAAGVGGTIRANGDTTLVGVVTAGSFVGNITGDVNAPAFDTNPAGVVVTGVATATGFKATGIVTAASFQGDGSALTGIAATTNVSTSDLFVVGVSTLTGQANIGSGVTINSTGIEVTSGIVTAKAFVPTTGQLSNRNLIINGAMNVAQRGTSSTTAGECSLTLSIRALTSCLVRIS